MFILNIKRSTGKTERIELDADDVEEITFETCCAYCRKPIIFDEYEFGQIAAEADFYSTWFCDTHCSESAKAMQEFKVIVDNKS